ncbi:MAG: hypothetical protein K2X47_06460, partial [Bdellovibrionales bacterium]|nr:hypothetical protein [Bdellovibrionales bacterium]
MTQVLKIHRFEQLIGGVALLFLATLFNSHGMRLLCLAIGLKIVTLSPQDQAQTKRMVMVGALAMIAIYLGSLPGLFCLVIAEFANHLMSGRMERGQVRVMDLALESSFLIPLVFAFLFDLFNMGGAAEVCIYLALGLRLTQWPLSLRAEKKDDVDRVASLLFGIAIVKMLAFTVFQNWMIGAAVLIALSGLTLSLSGGMAIFFAFLTSVNPNCAVFAAAALFCVDHEKMSSLLLPALLVPTFFLIQATTLFGENWWLVTPFVIWSLRGFSQAS